ncbi:hypothetical protein COCON_G00024520 [Conger conger]|uniref:Uncharacterized protein n=1 Tax=Conger conger TaxID=82655 RepID=A0A9Q1I4S2_CONCO|nr:hypothetical protein COCON_G00024520 [Conger conger]
MHGQRQPGGAPGAEQAEGADPGGAGADRLHARDRAQPGPAAAPVAPATGAGPHQEPAAAEVQEPVHVRHPQSLGPRRDAGRAGAPQTPLNGHSSRWTGRPWSGGPQPRSCRLSLRP